MGVKGAYAQADEYAIVLISNLLEPITAALPQRGAFNFRAQPSDDAISVAVGRCGDGQPFCGTPFGYQFLKGDTLASGWQSSF